MAKYPRRTSLQAIRAFCMECQNGYGQVVTDCKDAACPFYDYRHGAALDKGEHRPTGAIKRYCHEQCQAGGGREEVATCQGDKAVLGPCPVFPFRLGVNPNISAEERERRRLAAIERGPVGIIATQMTRRQTTFQAPESTESARGDL